MRTFYSRALMRSAVVVCALLALAGGVVLVVSGSAVGTMLLVVGALGALGGGASELAARRYPADATAEPYYAGPDEAGWGRATTGTSD